MRGQVAQWIPTAIFSSACWPCKPTFRRKGLPPKHPDLAESDSLLGACLTYRRRYAEAEPLLLAA